MLFQIGIMLKLLLLFNISIWNNVKNETSVLLTTECTYGPPASVYRHSPD